MNSQPEQPATPGEPLHRVGPVTHAARRQAAVAGHTGDAATARELGLRVDVVATEHTIAGLVDAMTAMS